MTLTLQSLHEGNFLDTFQLIISTDGRASFAVFAYSDPGELFTVLEEDPDAAIGFDAGTGMSGADFGQFLLRSGRHLEAAYIFRIDGKAVV